MEVLRYSRGWNLEHLKGNRKGQCSLRLNKQYRLIITPLDEDHIQVTLSSAVVSA